jgi:hypothetical protein
MFLTITGCIEFSRVEACFTYWKLGRGYDDDFILDSNFKSKAAELVKLFSNDVGTITHFTIYMFGTGRAQV